MIVSLEELKHVLGLPLGPTDEDAHLTRLILSATAWVEGETHRRFQEPISFTEYRDGNVERRLFLYGHIDDSSAADSATEGDPTTSLHIFRRPVILGSSTDWEELIVNEDWERRRDTVLFLRMWGVWPCEDEFRLTYLDGYQNAPEDIKQVVLELARDQFLTDVASAEGTAGITSETIGDYSYTVDLGAVATASGSLSGTSRMTILRYQKKFV